MFTFLIGTVTGKEQVTNKSGDRNFEKVTVDGLEIMFFRPVVCEVSDEVKVGVWIEKNGKFVNVQGLSLILTKDIKELS